MDTAIVAAVSAAGTVGGYLGQRVIDAAVDKLAEAVIRPCAEKRAHAYFHQLADAMNAREGGIDDAETMSALLDHVTKRDSVRETVFEYYRQAVLSRSKETGPRLLALLTARLIAEDRKPTPSEQQVADIAEACTDEDLTQFMAYFETLTSGTSPTHAKRVFESSSGFLVRLDQDSSDSSRPSAMQSGPLNLASELGQWAAKLERLGAIEQHIQTSTEQRRADRIGDSDHHVVVTRIEWSVFLGEACRDLAKLMPLATVRAA